MIAFILLALTFNIFF
ncbi:hypothetical protein NM540_000390 [Salmonella enterica]|nr:hypothetical protein [Salmonella enterica subsp. enterica serovar Oranienburg]EHK8788237.1 hypothetical protein [Salmonella enterica subsp. enterica serovar Carno]EHM8751851.1 hypothetical protein [Salmonella enterica]EHM9584207.1 hypothetical protein [Salmonella enterica subsp. enterica serovar Fresno]EIU7445772.1 hypothetical protein [Salmonella enterica subsp. enterica serovar Elomrane]EIX9105704.1 hypothetical protein [Klebsiella pneumoniae]EJH0675538.1 hypothetical protein [Escherichi